MRIGTRLLPSEKKKKEEKKKDDTCVQQTQSSLKPNISVPKPNK